MAKTKPFNDIHEVRQLLGVCNFFKGHFQNVAQITAPLNVAGLPLEDTADAARSCQSLPRTVNNSSLEAVGPLSSARATLLSHH